MLDFSFIPDEKPVHHWGLTYVGGIEYEEFVAAQDLKIIESHLDYYGKFRWMSQNVQQKRAMLTSAVAAAVPNLAFILKQAFTANCGLVAFGD
ncbi:hypothetical protein [Hymenobacter coccineus]|uniref:Uncharacterized protein n=1 Tax=Hymenobacter coccineus TaxID=1908235 RepID=A0A1G1TBP2_9BACT|nr:hypothetical protein [Hymenobacter coccineus]OGX88294.1 hypothetical protein BEN49_10240 [Hymenobacter coccineus]